MRFTTYTPSRLKPLSVGLALSELSCKTSRPLSILCSIPDLPRAKPLLGPMSDGGEPAAHDRQYLAARHAAVAWFQQLPPRLGAAASATQARRHAHDSSGQPSTRCPADHAEGQKLRVSGSTQVSSPSKRRIPTRARRRSGQRLRWPCPPCAGRPRFRDGPANAFLPRASEKTRREELAIFTQRAQRDAEKISLTR